MSGQLSDSGNGWKPVVSRVGGGRGTDGAGARRLYVFYAPALDAGYRARLCGQHLAAHGVELEFLPGLTTRN